MGSSKNSEKTKAKIIEAASELFADLGFKGVTVRDIINKAETNLSALNYHFGSKEKLYRDVVMEACNISNISEADQAALRRLEPRFALTVLVNEAIAIDTSKPSSNWQNAIITKECLAPTHVFDEVTKEYFKPMGDFVSELIGKCVGKPADDKQVRFAMIVAITFVDTLGQYHRLINAMAPGLTDYLIGNSKIIDQIVETIINIAEKSEESN